MKYTIDIDPKVLHQAQGLLRSKGMVAAANALREAVPLALAEDENLWDPGPACRVCGCTEDRACDGGCWWVEEDLCSRCADSPGKDA